MPQILRHYAWIVANFRASPAFRDFERTLCAFGFIDTRTRRGDKAYLHPAIGAI